MGMMAMLFWGPFLVMLLASPVHGRIRSHGVRRQQQQQQQPLLQHPHQQIMAATPYQYDNYDGDGDNRHVHYGGDAQSPWIEPTNKQIKEVKRDVPTPQHRRLGMSSKSNMGGSKSKISASASASSKSKGGMSSKSKSAQQVLDTRPPTQVPTKVPTMAPSTAVPTIAQTTQSPTTIGPTITGTTATPTTAPPTTIGSTAPPSTSPPTSITGTTASPVSIAPTPTSTVTTTTIAPADCTANPQDYNVNVDVQIQFPDDEFAACDSAEQDAAINTNIQAALNENFATAVPDWQGRATFGSFLFDPNQEVNNVDPFGGLRHRRHVLVVESYNNLPFDIDNNHRQLQVGCPSRAAVACTTPDYCRWGCIVASTTNCGIPPSTTASWATNLAAVIRTRLAALGFDCLGIPDQLQVVVVVDIPTAVAARSADMTDSTTTATTRANGFLVTEFPESEAKSSAANDNDNDFAVAVAANVANAFASNSGVELDTIQQLSSSVEPGTGFVTRRPTPSPAPPDKNADDASSPMTAEKAIAMANDQNVDIRSYNNNGEPCTQDFVLYTVNVDVQITNTNGAYCSEDPDAVARMRDAVTQAANDGFGTTVPDWKGDVGFFPIFWDEAQEVPAGQSNAGEERHQRALQFSTCPPRSIECTTNNCMWGCLWAPTTNCGISTLTNWANLGDAIRTALVDLGLDCLGTTDQLQVNVLVDDPVVLVEDSSTDNTNELKPTRGTPGTTLLSAPIKEGDDTAADDQGSNAAFPIHSQVTFTFFQGKGRQPKSNEIEDMTAKFKEFFTRVFKSNDKFAPAFQDIEFSKFVPKYNAAVSPDEFFIEFITTVLVDEAAAVTPSEAAHVMAESSLTDFITHYLKKSPWSAFSQTMKIFFKAVTQDT